MYTGFEKSLQVQFKNYFALPVSYLCTQQKAKILCYS